jgi:hypothetical protein
MSEAITENLAAATISAENKAAWGRARAKEENGTRSFFFSVIELTIQ